MVDESERRTQEQRRAETQAALLDATIDSLVECGYAGTTTREVARRAKVSRGAQTHHYPTKEDLVVAAVERLFDEQAAIYEARFQALPVAEQTLEQGVALLWEIVSGRAYPAVLEVVVAGRTDPALRVVVHAVAAKLEETVVGLLRSLLPGVGQDDRWGRTLIDLAFSVVQGAAVSSYGGFGDPDHTIAVVRRIAGLLGASDTRALKGLLDDLEP